MHRRRVLQGLAGAVGLQLGSSLWLPAYAQTKPGRWTRYESANFIVFSAMDERTTREEIVALERFNTLLGRLVSRRDKGVMKLTVQITDTDADFEATAPGMGDGIAGFYQADVEQVRAVTAPRRGLERQTAMPRNLRAMDARVVLFHEYAHHFVAANSRVAYPKWYNEGFAEFIATADFSDKGVHIGRLTGNRAQWLMGGGWLKIESLLTGEGVRTGEDMAMFYAQSWLATHYMFMTRERAAGFDRYCLALQDGGDPLGAFQGAFGISPADFDKELNAYKRKPMQFLLLPEEKRDHASGIMSARLSPSADNLLMPMAHLRNVPAKGAAAAAIARVRDEAARHPGDALAQQALAMIEVWYGDLTKARAILDTLLKADAKNPETHHLSGLCDLRSSRAADDEALAVKARGAFTAAHRLDESRASSLFRYVECDLYIEGEMTEHMVDVLVSAYHIAPQIKPLAMMTGQALIQHERWEEAAYVLRPLASAAHGGEMPEIAKRYLEAAQAKEKAPFVLFGAAHIVGQN